MTTCQNCHQEIRQHIIPNNPQAFVDESGSPFCGNGAHLPAGNRFAVGDLVEVPHGKTGEPLLGEVKRVPGGDRNTYSVAVPPDARSWGHVDEVDMRPAP